LGLATPTIAQRISAVSGGTRTETAPHDKKQIRLIAESPSLKLTISTGGKFGKQFAGMTSIYLKIENISDKPLTITTSKFNAIDEEGRAYAGLEFQEAMKRYFDTHAGTFAAIGGAVAGPLSGPTMNKAAERKITEDMRRQSLESGDIPPHSFKDGAVFFEAPKKKQYTLKISLADLWLEPFVFTTDK
jgi:hypothetical protein